MLQERISEPLRRVVQHPAAGTPSRGDDPRVDLKELIRIINRRRALAREHLDADPEFGAPSNGVVAVALRSGLGFVGIEGDASDRGDPQLKALRQLKKRLGVKRSDKAFVVDVYVSSDDRAKSVRIADAIAQAYLDDQAAARAAASGRASTALGARLDALRRQVQQAEDRVVQYREQHKSLAAGGGVVNEHQVREMPIELN